MKQLRFRWQGAHMFFCIGYARWVRGTVRKKPAVSPGRHEPPGQEGYWNKTRHLFSLVVERANGVLQQQWWGEP